MIQDLFFIAAAVMTVGGALLAVSLKNVFYNALSLILCLFGVACLFIFLNSEFLAVVEVIVYIGAIAVAIIFAIMLSRPMFQKYEKRDLRKTARALVTAAFLFVVLRRAMLSAPWAECGTDGNYSISGIGKAFLTSALVPFEIVSLILMIAIIGALFISGNEGSA